MLELERARVVDRLVEESVSFVVLHGLLLLQDASNCKGRYVPRSLILRVDQFLATHGVVPSALPRRKRVKGRIVLLIRNRLIGVPDFRMTLLANE